MGTFSKFIYQTFGWHLCYSVFLPSGLRVYFYRKEGTDEFRISLKRDFKIFKKHGFPDTLPSIAFFSESETWKKLVLRAVEGRGALPRDITHSAQDDTFIFSPIGDGEVFSFSSSDVLEIDRDLHRIRTSSAKGVSKQTSA